MKFSGLKRLLAASVLLMAPAVLLFASPDAQAGSADERQSELNASEREKDILSMLDRIYELKQIITEKGYVYYSSDHSDYFNYEGNRCDDFWYGDISFTNTKVLHGEALEIGMTLDQVIEVLGGLGEADTFYIGNYMLTFDFEDNVVVYICLTKLSDR